MPGQGRVAGDTVGVEAFAAKAQMLFEASLRFKLLNVMGFE